MLPVGLRGRKRFLASGLFLSNKTLLECTLRKTKVVGIIPSPAMGRETNLLVFRYKRV